LSEDFFYTFYKKRGSKILLRYVRDGKKHTVIMDDYKPNLYFPNNQVEAEGATKSIYGEPLQKKSFSSIKDAATFGKDYEQMGGSVIYGNRLFENQCIIEMFEGKTPTFKRNQIDIGIIDIETDYDTFSNPQECKYQIQQIAIKNTREQVHYSFGLKEFDQEKHANVIAKCTVVHVQCDTEEAMVESFIRHMEEKRYDLTTGWNSDEFDMPYIIERTRKILGKPMANRLSPFGVIYEKETLNKWKNPVIKYEIVGMPHLDYMLVYQKHTYTPRENYKLDTIAQAEGVAGKTDFSATADSLKELWVIDPDLYIAYNIQDTEIIDDLDKKLGLFDLIFTMSYLTLSNYEDAMGTTRIWEQFIAKKLYNNNVAPLFVPVDTTVREFEGAFVHPTITGKHKWVVSFDLKSLYPHIIQQVNIGPETIVPHHKLPQEIKSVINPTNNVTHLLNRKIDTTILKKYNLSMAANGVFYTKEHQSFLSEIMESLYSDRVVYQGKKKEAKQKLKDGDESYKDLVDQYDNMQMGMKILLNSGYGALANKHFLYFMVDTAESITTTGQLVNKWCSYQINDLLCDVFKKKDNYIVSGDTDSFYISLAPLGNKLMEKFDGDMEKVVDKLDQLCVIIGNKLKAQCTDLAEYLNSYNQCMHWSREVIAQSSIMVAKKRYVMKVLDDEGVRMIDKPKYKIMGMESVKGSTPAWAKALLVDCYKIALDGDESDLHDMVAKFEKEFYTYPIEAIAIPTGVNNILKYADEQKIYAKGAPKQVKAALIHNWVVKKYDLKITPIVKDGSKIRVVTLRKPNPINQVVIGFEGTLPKEFGLDQYVDRTELFNKGFLSPLNIFLAVTKWTHEEVNTLF